MTDNYIKPEEFLAAFKKTWTEFVDEKGDEEIISNYSYRKPWTGFMPGNKEMSEEAKQETVLYKVMNKLNEQRTNNKLQYRSEFFTVDVAYRSGKNLYDREDYKPAYPKLHVLIEHENGEDVETEMYKLIFLRSPLKVIIFYDWDECDKTNNDKEKWLDEKLKKFAKMLETANDYLPENEATEYLFIIGDRENEQAMPRWQYASISSKNNQLMPLKDLYIPD